MHEVLRITKALRISSVIEQIKGYGLLGNAEWAGVPLKDIVVRRNRWNFPTRGMGAATVITWSFPSRWRSVKIFAKVAACVGLRPR
jgi:hypothetical protein